MDLALITWRHFAEERWQGDKADEGQRMMGKSGVKGAGVAVSVMR